VIFFKLVSVAHGLTPRPLNHSQENKIWMQRNPNYLKAVKIAARWSKLKPNLDPFGLHML